MFANGRMIIKKLSGPVKGIAVRLSAHVFAGHSSLRQCMFSLMVWHGIVSTDPKFRRQHIVLDHSKA